MYSGGPTSYTKSTNTCQYDGCNKPCNPGHQYCSLTHGQIDKGQRASTATKIVRNVTATVTNALVGRKRCALPGCDEYCFEENGYVHNYCRKSHAVEHQKILSQPQTTQQTHVQQTLPVSRTTKVEDQLIWCSDSIKFIRTENELVSRIGNELQAKIAATTDFEQALNLLDNNTLAFVLVPDLAGERLNSMLNRILSKNQNVPVFVMTNAHIDHRSSVAFVKTLDILYEQLMRLAGNRMVADPMTIYFYNRNEKYYEFTNFWEGNPIEVNGVSWPTTEHYFQAMKFESNPQIMEHIRKLSSPRDAFNAAREYQQYRNPDWEKIKDQVMLEAVYRKFTQHPKLRQLLLSTGSATLVERTANDSYWGDGGDGSGRNQLGKTLMKVRDRLTELHQQPQQDVDPKL